MKSPWKVSSNPIEDSMQYGVYRLQDMNEVDHSGNREYGSELMTDRHAAKALAVRLNMEEGR